MSTLLILTEAAQNLQGTAQMLSHTLTQATPEPLTATIQVAGQVAGQVGTQVAGHLAPMASDGIIDWATEKLGDIKSLFRVLAVVLAIGFVLYQALQSRGAMSRIVITGISAGVFIWIVFNVTAVQDRVDSEINGAPSSQSPVTQPGS